MPRDIILRESAVQHHRILSAAKKTVVSEALQRLANENPRVDGISIFYHDFSQVGLRRYQVGDLHILYVIASADDPAAPLMVVDLWEGDRYDH